MRNVRVKIFCQCLKNLNINLHIIQQPSCWDFSKTNEDIYLCKYLFRSIHRSITYNNQTQYVYTGEQTNVSQWSHTMKFYSATQTHQQ